MSELLCELVRHWADVVAIFLNTVHVALVEASGDMQMRFALWAIIMQIGKKMLSLLCSSWGSVFVKKMFGFCGFQSCHFEQLAQLVGMNVLCVFPIDGFLL